jgi:phosphatidylserine/phosphatidylglycerophosphate/cardiolipin synthase-like enzyme
MLVDARLGDTYAGTLDRLAGLFELRRWDASQELGGIQHAKYMIVDEAQLFVGSANFDWRSLSHIHEIGVRLEAPAIAREIGSLFELDWVLAAPGATPRPALAAPAWERVELGDGQQIELVASPRGWLPDESAWELEPLLALVAGARERLSIELLEYDAAFRDGSAFAALDDALRAAAARGVKVRLLLSNWQLRHPEAAQRLQQAEGIEVAIVTIPPHASGFIPFARVIHAKYAVADGEIAWIGSSNWQGDYFHLSRNVGVVVRGRPIASELEAVFARLAESPHATPLDPAATYEAPRVGP